MTIPFDPFGRLSAQLLAMTLDPSKKWNSKRSSLEESMGFWWYKRTKQAREKRGKEERKKKMEKKRKRERPACSSRVNLLSVPNYGMAAADAMDKITRSVSPAPSREPLGGRTRHRMRGSPPKVPRA